MRNNETGEFELVVGNRQLLSGFFIVVLLFAVAFAMGYVVGQNSPRNKQEAVSSAPPAEGRPQPTEPVAAPALPPDQTQASAAQNDARTEASAPADNSNAPAADTPAAPAPAASDASPEAVPGSYWQVMAVSAADAKVVVGTLKDKGFPAVMTPGPKDLMRVLVGPYDNTQAMGRAKTELEGAGFHPIRK